MTGGGGTGNGGADDGRADVAIRPHVGLLVTCLVDLFRPGIGFAAVRLLERAGCDVDVPRGQTCCGQPALSSGDRAGAAALARQTVAAFEEFDYVVAPSGSCAATVRVHAPALLADDPPWAERAVAVAGRTWELTRFLVEVLGQPESVATAAPPRPGQEPEAGVETLVYHDSCTGRRVLGIQAQPRRLLAAIPGLTVRDAPGPSDACCGFGGPFCLNHPEISTQMADARLEALAATGATGVLGGDLGCLLHLAGRAGVRGSRLTFRHVAEVLAGMTDTPPLAGPAKGRSRDPEPVPSRPPVAASDPDPPA